MDWWDVTNRSASPQARYFAAAVPMLKMCQLMAVGSGAVREEGLVRSVSRSGKREELLQVWQAGNARKASCVCEKNPQQTLLLVLEHVL